MTRTSTSERVKRIKLSSTFEGYVRVKLSARLPRKGADGRLRELRSTPDRYAFLTPLDALQLARKLVKFAEHGRRQQQRLDEERVTAVAR